MWEIFCGLWLLAGALQAAFSVIIALLLQSGRGTVGKVTPPVSIVLCAHRPHPGLPALLEVLGHQTYPTYEVVVVNDGPHPEVAEMLSRAATHLPMLRNIDLDAGRKSTQGKKDALRAGIKAAKYPWVLLTDADCSVGEHWIASMVGCLGEQTEVVIGLSPHERESSVLNRVFRFDTVMIAFLYAGMARAGMPYMAVGRNLLYRKSLRNDIDVVGRDLMSGDDDLFIQSAANSQNAAVCLDENSFTYSRAEPALGSFIHQKRRHLSTGREYRTGHKILLAIFNMSFVLFWIGFFGLVVWEYGMVVYAMTGIAVLQWVVIGSLAKRMRSGDLVLTFPLLAVAYCFLLISLPVLLVAGPPRTWRS